MSTQHPTFLRCLAVARSAGSTAKTVRGVLRFFRDNPQMRLRRKLYPDPAHRPNPAAYKAAELARKSDPEAKRAKHDRDFRRRYLAGLNRREHKAIKCDGKSIQDVARYYSEVSDRRKTLEEIARLRSIVTGKQCEPLKAPEFGHRIPVSDLQASSHGVKIVRRGKDSDVYSTKQPSHFVHRDGETEWKGGKAVGYTRAVNDNFVRSLAVIRDPQTLDYLIHETTYTITLPDGYAWDSDQNGLKAIRVDSPKDDFHPTAGDFIHETCLTGHIVRQIDVLRAARLRWAAENATEIAQNEGVFVCLADSLRAGNCLAGTLAFASRHHLDTTRHYSAAELLQQANGDAGRVRLAITAARFRHNQELERGYCELSDHAVLR